jgi:adenosylhomocysteine nucleosidase
MADVLIATPLQKEHDFFTDRCVQSGFHVERAVLGRLPVVRLPELGITVARGGTGKAQFAAQMQHLLDAGGRWELAVCAGAAGSLVDQVSVGDVVVATTTVEHDFNNRFSTRALPRFDGAGAAIESLRIAATRMDAFSVHFGPVASGDEDVVAMERRQALHDATGGLAVAWEGAGGARACQFSNVPFVEVRGVTDAANEGAAGAFEVHLETAMKHVAMLLISWMN